MDAYIDVGIDNWMLNRWIVVLLQGGRGHWAVYFTSPQSFLITFSYSLAQQLWGLLLNFDRLVN